MISDASKKPMLFRKSWKCGGSNLKQSLQSGVVSIGYFPAKYPYLLITYFKKEPIFLAKRNVIW